MKVTILGSCTVAKLPEDLDLFFDGEYLIDVRNGYRMEMDSLPLAYYADWVGDNQLKSKLLQSLLRNLEESGGDIWRCGCWGHNEVHLRFTSIAIRFLIFNRKDINEQKLAQLVEKHVSYSEEVQSGLWFYHDSLELSSASYYPIWRGVECLKASNNNMLILNTHLDTLSTLLMYKHTAQNTEFDKHIDAGISALVQFLKETEIISGVPAFLDRLMRNCYLSLCGRKAKLSNFLRKVMVRLYYRGIRRTYKQRHNIRRFKDGFSERDIRLYGNDLEYHIVNLWDMSKLLYWTKISGIENTALTTCLLRDVIEGLEYISLSSVYKKYLSRISGSKGVSNEVLETIAILFSFGKKEDWLQQLYLDLRKLAPPSFGVKGLDVTLSPAQSSVNKKLLKNIPEEVDYIPFYDGQGIIINHSKKDVEVNLSKHIRLWSSTSSTFASKINVGEFVLITSKFG